VKRRRKPSAAWGVRRARPGDGPVLKALRRRALTGDPLAFGSTWEQESKFTAAKWRVRVAHGGGFFLEGPDGPSGLAWGLPDVDHPGDALLVSMWVAPPLRGSGAADALVEAVLAWAKAEGIPRIRLDVGTRNRSAIRLYERHDFRCTGLVRPGDHSGVVEQEMERTLKQPRGRR
jgi:GNAT superfamily N-acetyltransferase